ncbi:LuxR family two component transcriptional regulator [Propionibacteriaceae bacterium ES.041]|uniref:response regulator n=1 Tax=Enemella evansiae TaxID=2016499 RepID=UPI000B9789CD|nr:response regulator transcription factor [Enemella evansiae]OYN95025.1 DNA-binding response regulator [Enemella evansiae]OYO04785.1 DNA-binding response regulator [Enemella evansiae]PFG66225.1 LuxR family two component transcriptional regulator [Propionibacteriaceae bacterium ES.041]
MRLIVAEDFTLLREGLVRLLGGEGHEVVATVADAANLVRAVERHVPELAIIDIRMPPTHTDEGLRAALEIRQNWPQVAILVLSQHIERKYAATLLSGDVSGVGYLLKDRVTDIPVFLDALEQLTAGGTVIDPEVVRQLLSRSAQASLSRLTSREHEVLAALAEGRTNLSIAAHLHLSVSAVEKHLGTIFDKLNLKHEDGYNPRILAVLRYLQS